MANYYIDVIVPDDRARKKAEGRSMPAEPPLEFLSSLREEIRKYEDSPGRTPKSRYTAYQKDNGNKLYELEVEGAEKYRVTMYEFYRATIVEALGVE